MTSPVAVPTDRHPHESTPPLAPPLDPPLDPPPFRSGFVAIAGQPNTGKSTFLNAALGRKLAIVTPKAQTTRTRILGVCHRPHSQMVFLDTPGIHQPGRSSLNKILVKTAYQSCQDVDAILYFMDAGRGMTEDDQAILAQLPYGTAPLFLMMNKVDLIDDRRLFAHLQRVQGMPCTATIPLSARTGYNVEHVLSILPAHLPEGPRYFPENQWTDQSEHFFAAEIIREKLFFYLQKELPYALAVRLERFSERAGANTVPPLWDMAATILVERTSQKAIVIGHKGYMLKKVGSSARRELETLFGVKLYLELHVKVRKDWSGNPTLLRDIGYLAE